MGGRNVAFSDPTYVIFDGDEDKWAYGRMKGWNALENVDFDFRDAHELDSMTARAQGEEYGKKQLRQRMVKPWWAVIVPHRPACVGRDRRGLADGVGLEDV